MNGTELKAKRNKLGMTQVELAEALKITSTFVGMMERNSAPIKTTTQHAVWCLMYEAQVAKIGDRK